MTRHHRAPSSVRILHRSRRGFTIVELMVALTAGLIAITTIYTLSSSSARHFNEQQRIAQTQMAVRQAADQLRRDIERAGFFSTPNADSDKLCGGRAVATPAFGGNLSGIEYLIGQDTNELVNVAQNTTVRADRLYLLGNFHTNDDYEINPPSGGRAQLTFNQVTHEFARSFGVNGPTGSTYQPDRFESVFDDSRYLSVRDRANNFFLMPIRSSAGPMSMVTVSPPLPACAQVGAGARVAPVSRVVYQAMSQTSLGGSGSSLALTGSGATGSENSVLIRAETQLGDTTNFIPNTERVVLEYVVDFRLGFVVDTNETRGMPPVLERIDSNNVARLAYVQNNPQDVRTVIMSLSARTADMDRNFPWVPQVAGQPLTRYKPAVVGEGAARVRTVRTEIAVPNLGARPI